MACRLKINAALAFLFCCAAIGQDTPRNVRGKYRNPALGFSIIVPPGLTGSTGDQAGPERGISISLHSGGRILVYGEPNSLEWKSPEEGLRRSFGEQTCQSRRNQQTSPTRIGRLDAAKGKVECDDQVTEALLAFRTGGGPIYWFTLRTKLDKAREDEKVLDRVVESFRLIRWR